jgi:hypothetical protein
MSGSRAFRRQGGRSTPPPAPPAHLIAAARRQQCPDCDSDISLNRDRSGMWHVAIAHDPGCVQMRWRQEHGATSGLMIAAEPGRTIPADLVTEAVDALSRATGSAAVRVAFDGNGAVSWQERQAIAEALRRRGRQP